MKKTEIILVGAHGKMGREIDQIASSSKIYEIVARVGRGENFQRKSKWPKKAVVIDFSTPEAIESVADFCVENKFSLVVGTTGLKEIHFNKLKMAGQKVPVLWSPNMSRGVNIFLSMIEKIGPAFADLDLQIEESHHVHKKDKPSGTALALQRAAEKATKKKLPEIHVTRAGGIIGQHKLSIVGEDEILTIEHVAFSRRVFARGALEVAKWLQNQPAGYYNMQDFINYEK